MEELQLIHIDLDVDECSIETIRKSLQTWGFLQIRTELISNDEMLAAFETGSNFFYDSTERKLLATAKDKARRGYSSSMSENFACLAGVANEPNDSVEKFRVGPEASMAEILAMKKDEAVHFSPNDFSHTPAGFDVAMTTMYRKLLQVAKRVLHILAVAFLLPENFFDAKLSRTTSILTMNYYPYDADHMTSTRVTRVAEHTDVSMITIVAQSNCQATGIEIKGADGSWHRVSPQDGAFIVNIGDCLKDWSNCILKSTMHRVVTAWDESDSDACGSGVSCCRSLDRFTFAFFVSPNYDALLEWPTSGSDANASAQPVNYTTWRKRRVKTAMQMLRCGIEHEK